MHVVCCLTAIDSAAGSVLIQLVIFSLPKYWIFWFFVAWMFWCPYLSWYKVMYMLCSWSNRFAALDFADEEECSDATQKHSSLHTTRSHHHSKLPYWNTHLPAYFAHKQKIPAKGMKTRIILTQLPSPQKRPLSPPCHHKKAVTINSESSSPMQQSNKRNPTSVNERN